MCPWLSATSKRFLQTTWALVSGQWSLTVDLILILGLALMIVGRVNSRRTWGMDVVGTIGVLLRAKQSGVVRAVEPLLSALQAEGFRMGGVLHREALRLAGEE